MSEVIQSAVLGIVQGLTEFLPVSSSGHLEIAKVILGDDSIAEESLLMTVTLHAATAISTIVVFWKDIIAILKGLFTANWNEDKAFAVKIILSMIPAAMVGVLFEEQIEALFSRNLLLVGAMLIITGLLLFLADRAKKTDQKVSYIHSIIIGLAQAIAIIPGISRSGATISTSVLLGIDRARAARFSFLMVVPLILGKMAKDLLDGEFTANSDQTISLIVGFIAAFVTGLFACLWMIQLVKNSKLTYFSVYCFIVGLIAIAYVLV
ncbi:MAG: undecaprenyl-diphosphate phosphatase [Bacteroidota bacterium]